MVVCSEELDTGKMVTLLWLVLGLNVVKFVIGVVEGFAPLVDGAMEVISLVEFVIDVWVVVTLSLCVIVVINVS